MHFDVIMYFGNQNRLDFGQGIGQVVCIAQPLLEKRFRTFDEALVFLKSMDDGSVKDAWKFEQDETWDERLIVVFPLHDGFPLADDKGSESISDF